MPNLDQELAHLALADEHVATAEKGVNDMQTNLDAQRSVGGEVVVLEQSLNVAKEALHQFQVHRRLIINTIADIRTGKLPSS